MHQIANNVVSNYMHHFGSFCPQIKNCHYATPNDGKCISRQMKTNGIKSTLAMASLPLLCDCSSARFPMRYMVFHFQFDAAKMMNEKTLFEMHLLLVKNTRCVSHYSCLLAQISEAQLTTSAQQT